MYNTEEVKSYGLRLSKRISKEIQRSESIHPIIKANFVSNTALNENAGGLESYVEVNINNKPLDSKAIIKEIGGRVYSESLKEIDSIIDRVLIQENAKDYFDKKIENPSNEVFNYHNNIKDRYIQFRLESYEGILTEYSEEEPVAKVMAGFDMVHRNYYVEPEKEGNATTMDLVNELKQTKENEKEYIPNVFNMPKTDLNSSDHDLAESYNQYKELNNMTLEELLGC